MPTTLYHTESDDNSMTAKHLSAYDEIIHQYPSLQRYDNEQSSERGIRANNQQPAQKKNVKNDDLS